MAKESVSASDLPRPFLSSQQHGCICAGHPQACLAQVPLQILVAGSEVFMWQQDRPRHFLVKHQE